MIQLSRCDFLKISENTFAGVLTSEQAVFPK
jgi:hypothetical protein